MQEVSQLLKRLAAPVSSPEATPRLLVVLAHPDDEVLALGGRLERFGNSRFLCVTNGAPEDGEDARAHGLSSLQAYAETRRGELEAAFRLAGLPTTCARQLVLSAAGAGGGTNRGREIPDQGSVFCLAELARKIAREIELFRPEAILTHPYEGGHPDHDSCAFAVHAALALGGGAGASPVLEAAFYHSRGIWRPGEGGLETGRFLPVRGPVPVSAADEVVCELSPDESRRKRERLDCFATQRETLAQFRTEKERFRGAPTYDFTQPPHAGRLLFEEFAWGVTGSRFRELAAAALDALGLRSTTLAAASGARQP